MTDEEKIKKRKEENEEQMLIALALLLYPDVDESNLTIESIPAEVKEKLSNKIDAYFKKDVKPLNEFTKSDILKTALEIANIKSDYFEVVTVGDDKTCDNCKKWTGKIISDDDDKYPSYSDFENSGAVHWGCRCFLKPVSVKTSANNRSMKDSVVFSGFYSVL